MSEDVLPWFPCRASKLIGALVALPHDEQVVYNMVLLRIYEKGGPIDESVTALARRTDTPKRRIETALDSLIRKGKIERLENGLLDSKSTHETLHEISAKKVLTKRAAKTRWEKPQQKQQKSDADAMLQTETYTKTKKEVASQPNAHAREPFDRFWIAWPNKVQKDYAEKCFAKVSGEIDAIMAGIERYKRDKPPDRTWMNPSTFLNQRRWNDSPAPNGATNHVRNGKGSLIDAGLELIQEFDFVRTPKSSDVCDDVVRLLQNSRGQ